MVLADSLLTISQLDCRYVFLSGKSSERSHADLCKDEFDAGFLHAKNMEALLQRCQSVLLETVRAICVSTTTETMTKAKKI